MSKMTPEERGEDVVNRWAGLSMSQFASMDDYWEEMRAIVARSVREAENAAYERAAVICQCDHDRHGTEEIAEMIRALKHKSA